MVIVLRTLSIVNFPLIYRGFPPLNPISLGFIDPNTYLCTRKKYGTQQYDNKQNIHHD
jgi:hypothetical protein